MTQRQREWVWFRMVTAGVSREEEAVIRRRIRAGMTRSQAQELIHDLWLRTEYAWKEEES